MKKIATIVLFCFMFCTPAFAAEATADFEVSDEPQKEAVTFFKLKDTTDKVAQTGTVAAPYIEYAEPITNGDMEILVRGCKRVTTYANGGKVTETYFYPFTVYMEDRDYYLGTMTFVFEDKTITETAICTVMPTGVGYAYTRSLDEDLSILGKIISRNGSIPDMPEVTLQEDSAYLRDYLITHG